MKMRLLLGWLCVWLCFAGARAQDLTDTPLSKTNMHLLNTESVFPNNVGSVTPSLLQNDISKLIDSVCLVDAAPDCALPSASVTNALGYNPLNPANNLSDLTNPATARINLGLQDYYLQNDGLTVTAVNTLSPLSKSYTGGLFELIVDGVAYTSDDLSPAFTVSGTTVTWNATNAGYSLATTDAVSAIYSAAGYTPPIALGSGVAAALGAPLSGSGALAGTVSPVLSGSALWRFEGASLPNGSPTTPCGTQFSGSYFEVGFCWDNATAHVNAGQLAEVYIAHNTPGSGIFGTSNSDLGLAISMTKTSYLTSTNPGELGALWITTWQGAQGDGSGLEATNTNVRGSSDDTGGVLGIGDIVARWVSPAGNPVWEVHDIFPYGEAAYGATGGAGYGGSIESWLGVQYAGLQISTYNGYSGAAGTYGFTNAISAFHDRSETYAYFLVAGDQPSSANLSPGDITQGYPSGQVTLHTDSSGDWCVNSGVSSTSEFCIPYASPYPAVLNRPLDSVGTFAYDGLLQSIGGTGWRWTLNNDATLRLQNTTNGFSTVMPVAEFTASGALDLFGQLLMTESGAPTALVENIALSGSTGLLNVNQINVASDTLPCAFCTDFYIQHDFGGASSRGAHEAFFGWSIQTAANTGTGVTVGIGGTFIGQANVTDGSATGPVYAGTYFGINPIGRNSGAYAYETTGGEADLETKSGSSSYYAIGWAIANFEAVQGTELDAALAIYSGASVAAAGGGGPWGPGGGFHNGIIFAELSANGLSPVDSAATLIGGHLESLSTINAANGADFTNFTFSGSAFKSHLFSVSQAGYVFAQLYYANGSTGASCSGATTSLFASVGGIVTHC